MSQKRVNLQRIANDKTRIITYKKRKACLYKKAEEFSTLCGIDTCLIVYGPTKATDEVVSEPEIWPRDETKVRDIIRKYRETVSNSCKKANHVETFVNDIGRTREMETNKRVKSNINKYCSWEEKLDKCSQEQLLGIFCAVENKLHEAMARQYRSMIRAHHQAMEIPITQSLMDQQQYSTMPQYYPMQQQFEGSMFPNNNMGFSFTSCHDDHQIQMDVNHVENWTELGLTQGLMMPKGNDVVTHQLMQGQGPCYNLEPVLQRQATLNVNPFAGYVGSFNTPWRMQSNQADDWFVSEKKEI